MSMKQTALSLLSPIITAISATSRPGVIAALTLSAGVLAGCSGQVPTQGEIDRDNIENRAQQLVRVGDTTRAGGDLANALQLYARAAEMRPDWSEPLQRTGETALQAGFYDEALKAFDRAQALVAPGQTAAVNGAGIALDLMGRHDEAQERYISGMEKAPDNLALKNNLGLSLAMSGNFDEAIQLLQGAAANPVAGVRTRHNLALVYGLAGNEDGARETAARDLDDAAVANNLAFYARLRAMTPEDRRKAVFGTLR